MASSLRDLERKGEIVAEVAARQPATQRDAIAGYAATRTREIKRDLWNLEATSEFRARDISYQCAAIAAIERALAGEEEPKKKGKKPSNVVQLAPTRTARQMQIDLAAVLRVEERASLYAPALEALKADAEVAIMKNESVRHNQAMGSEVDEFTRFLYRVEDAARRAQAELEQERRGGIPHDPRQVTGAVRVQM